METIDINFFADDTWFAASFARNESQASLSVRNTETHRAYAVAFDNDPFTGVTESSMLACAVRAYALALTHQNLLR